MCLCLVPTYPWKGYRGVCANGREKSEGGEAGEREGGREEGEQGREREKKGGTQGGMRATNTP